MTSLYTDAARVHVPDGDNGRLQPLYHGLGVGQGEQHRGAPNGRGSPWGARDHQFRPGQPVYEQPVAVHMRGIRHQGQHGWPRPLQGQHLDRAFLAYHQDGVYLHQPRRRRASPETGHQGLYRVLQQPPQPSGYQPPDTDGEIQTCGMSEKSPAKTMAIQNIIVYLSHPRKDDGETLRCR